MLATFDDVWNGESPSTYRKCLQALSNILSKQNELLNKLSTPVIQMHIRISVSNVPFSSGDNLLKQFIRVS